jgi:putative FmdB family regulatory protein
MPTYEYLCHNGDCSHEFETFQSMKDDALVTCPACKQPTLRRKIGLGAGIIFKGSGFYETDYKRKPQAEGSSTGNAKPSGESTPSESKSSATPATSAAPASTS